MANVARTGLIHRFVKDGPGPDAGTFLDTHAEFDPVPVEIRDSSTPGVLARGRLVEAAVDGDDLYGDIEWPEEIEERVNNSTPSSTCEWDVDTGRLRRVIIDLEDDDADDGHHDCGCGSPDACTCHAGHDHLEDNDTEEVVDQSSDQPVLVVDSEPPAGAGAAAAFRKWTQKDRDSLPDIDFGDPSNRLFPIADQDDVDSAARLIGKAKDPDQVKKRIIAICKRKGLTPPQGWMASFSATPIPQNGLLHEVAAFNLSAPIDDGEFVTYRDATLFKPGDYPTHQFSMTPEELWAAAQSFTAPVPNELEHVNTAGMATILDGHLGHVEDVRFSTTSQGPELKGTVKIPRWLDQVWDRHLKQTGGATKQVSCVWNRGTKALEKLGLVIKGHIEGASLATEAAAAFAAAKPAEAAAAFAKDSTWHGQSLLQTIHDQAAASGAMCSKKTKDMGGKVKGESDLAAMHAKHELDAIQMIHDAAQGAGAVCRFKPEGHDMLQNNHAAVSSPFARFAPMDDGMDEGMDEGMSGSKKKKMMVHKKPMKRGLATRAMQHIHDVVSMHPGICVLPNPDDDDKDVGGAPDTDDMPSAFGDKMGQVDAMKKIHDMSVEHGARCPMKSKSAAMSGVPSPTFSRKADMSAWDEFLGAVSELPDDPTDDQLAELVKFAPRDVVEKVATEKPVDPSAAFADNPVFKAQQEKIARLEAKEEAFRIEKAESEAAAFAEPNARRLLLSEEAAEGLASVFFAASEVDRKLGQGSVAFSSNGEQSTVTLAEAIRRVISAIPDNPLASPLVNSNGRLDHSKFSALPNNQSVDPKSPMSEEEKNKLLSLTQVGRDILKKKSKSLQGAR